MTSKALSQAGNGCVVIQYGSVFETFNFTGTDQTWTVPAGVTMVTFHLLGAGGGGGRAGTSAFGGGGGYASGSYGVVPGDQFVIIVGEGGIRQEPADVAGLTSATARRNVSFGGGASGQGNPVYGAAYGSGGGRSAVRVAGSNEDIATAGAGGGGGYTGAGGAGGGLSGQNGGGSGGSGGSQVAGGATHPSEPGVAGIKYAGGHAGTVISGNQLSEGGGGGGGWYGGGGAGDNGGGGGGSSHVALLTGGSTSAGSGREPGLKPPVNTTPPSIAGTASVGETLTATGGSWAVSGTRSWTWQRSVDGVTYTSLVGAASPTLEIPAAGYYRAVETHSNILGNASSASNVVRVRAVLDPPAAPDLDGSSDSGRSTTDNVTSDNTPRFSVGGISSGDTVTVSATKGSATLTCMFISSSIAGSCEMPALTDGAWTVNAARQDVDGNTSASSVLLSVTIDTVAPQAPGVPDLLASSDTGTSDSDDRTSDNTPELSVPGAAPSSLVEISVSRGSETVLCTFDTAVSSSCTLATLSDGTWQAAATLVDAAGNRSPASRPLMIIVEVPSVPSTTSTTTSTTVPAVPAAVPTKTEVQRSTPAPGTTLPDSRVPQDLAGLERVTEGVATVGGLPEGGWVKSERSGSALVISTSEGMQISIGARQGSEEELTLNARGMPVYSHGDMITIAGAGLRAGTPASVWLFSTPRELGELTVAGDGTFGELYGIPADVEPGDHTAQLVGIAPDGTLRVVEVKLEVLGTAPAVAPGAGAGGGGGSTVTSGGAPAQGNSLDIGLIASALALLAVSRGASPRGGGSDDAREEPAAEGSGEGLDDSDSVEREDAGGEVGSVDTARSEQRSEEARDRFVPANSLVVDSGVAAAVRLLDRWFPMLARTVDDGAYLRSLIGLAWLLMPLTGAVLGVVSAFDTGFVVMIPSLTLVTTVVVLGALDASAGMAFVATYSVSMLTRGALDDVASVRGLMGMAVLAFGPSLIAAAVRPFRRVSTGEHDLWNRATDLVLIVLFGSWAAATMFSALPSLTTYKPSHSGRTDFVQLVVMGALAARWVLENGARTLTPRRLREVEVAELEDPARVQRVLSTLVRTGVFAFVASVFIGNNWALWTGTAMFLVPKIVDEFAGDFPNVPMLHRYLPRNLLRVVLVLFVALWWGGLVNGWFGDSENAALYAFVLMGVPGHVLRVGDWFGRDGKPWESTVVSRTLGVLTLLVGILAVRGYIPG